MEEHLFKHTPVMLEECITGLNIKKNGVYVDGTLGGAGHSSEIVKGLTSGRLIAIDKDDNALNFSKQKLSNFSNVVFVKSDFKNFKTIINNLQIDGVDGILLDLGVSSHQIDTADRGFSYRFDGELDMRMDQTQTLTAKYVVNNYTESDLARIIYTYGEESFSRLIAKEICKQRKLKPIETTMQLKELIERVIPKKFQGGGSCCKKTFQALRIEVNQEMEALKEMLLSAMEMLRPGGRLVVITYHSLEDRMVKNIMKTGNIEGKTIQDFYGNSQTPFKLVNKVIIASDDEVKRNPRSRSAKLRIAEKK